MMGVTAGRFKRLFPQKRIKRVISAVLHAGSFVKKETNSDREDDITAQLHERLILSYPFRDGPLSIQRQPEIPASGPKTDYRYGQVDLLVPTELGYQVYFAIEAKRMRYFSPNGSFIPGNSAYVKDGMMRFVTGRYAALMGSGAMLGYVFDGQTDQARYDIDQFIQGKANELRLKAPKRFRPSKLLPGKSIDETHHDLTKRHFTIYHIFIAV